MTDWRAGDPGTETSEQPDLEWPAGLCQVERQELMNAEDAHWHAVLEQWEDSAEDILSAEDS